MRSDNGDKTARSRSFGVVAEEYERYRPSYPMAMYDDVVAYAGVGSGSRMLDVGAGTGKGLRPLAAQGLDVVALEPDPAMAAVLAREVPTVRVVIGTFESLAATDGPFELITSAQAWHWTDEATHWERAHSLLADAGAIALWWNHIRLADQPGLDTDAVRAAYAVHCPHIESDLGEGSSETDLLTGWPGEQMLASPLLCDVEARVYRWEREMSREDYLGMLDTQSAYRVLPDDVRAAFFADLTPALPERVRQDIETVLHLARRA